MMGHGKLSAARKGGVVIEVTLALMLFLLLLFGIFDMGFLMYAHQTLVHQARNAVRYGVVRAYDADLITNMILYNQPTAPSPGAPGVLNLTPANITVSRLQPNTANDRILVTVRNYSFGIVSPVTTRVLAGRPITVSMPMEGPTSTYP